jgi:DNA-binding NarL/FixJ family response regulator
MMTPTDGVSTDQTQASPGRTPREYRTTKAVGLIGGSKILRSSLVHLLAHEGLEVVSTYSDETELSTALGEQESLGADVLVLLISGGPFTTYHRIHDALNRTGHSVPLVILSEQASRGQVYAALRIGAKAYVNLDADPEELVKAIDMASQNKVYLAPDAAELLVNDISVAIEPSGSPRLPSVELSRREIEVVQLLCEGLSSKEIARRLHISAKTVENHRYNIYRKCEVDSIAGLMRHAIQNGLVTI